MGQRPGDLMSVPQRTLGGLAKLVAWPAALVVAWVYGVAMGDSMRTAWAAHPVAAHAAEAAPLALRDVAGYILAVGGAMTLVGGGWVAYAQLQFRKISGIGRSLADFKNAWEADRRDFLEKYYEHREQAMRDFATKAEVTESFQKLDAHLGLLNQQFSDGLKAIATRIGSLEQRRERKGG